jgi:hypothetical protein
MANNKKKKGPNMGCGFEEHRKKVGKALYSRGRGAITYSREVVRKEIREIIGETKQKSEEMNKKVSLAAKNGIKDLKIDGSRLLNFLKDIKMKESPSQYGKYHQPDDIQSEPLALHAKSGDQSKKSLSYYDIWYDLIHSEVKTIVPKK